MKDIENIALDSSLENLGHYNSDYQIGFIQGYNWMRQRFSEITGLPLDYIDKITLE